MTEDDRLLQDYEDWKLDGAPGVFLGSPWRYSTTPLPDPEDKHLSEMKDRYFAGDKFALIEAMNNCLRQNIQAPTWVRYGFGKALMAIMFYETGSWDELLARPLPKGKSVAKARRREELAWELHSYVYTHLIEQNPDRAIDNDLMSEAAEHFGIGQTLAWEYFSYVKSESPELHDWCESERQKARSKNNNQT